jgi:flagellar basal body-associated protein FliL
MKVQNLIWGALGKKKIIIIIIIIILTLTMASAAQSSRSKTRNRASQHTIKAPTSGVIKPPAEAALGQSGDEFL